MKKKLLSLLVGLFLLCGMLYACAEDITADQAVAIVMEDLGAAAEDADAPHVHAGTFQNKKCFNVYISVDGEEWTYVISLDGEIIAKVQGGSHSH